MKHLTHSDYYKVAREFLSSRDLENIVQVRKSRVHFAQVNDIKKPVNKVATKNEIEARLAMTWRQEIMIRTPNDTD